MVSEIYTNNQSMKFVHEKHLVERQKTKVVTSSLRTLEIMPRNPNESVRLRIPSQRILTQTNPVWELDEKK
jgi:hypothetical protein